MNRHSTGFRGRAATVGVVAMATLALGGLSVATAQADTQAGAGTGTQLVPMTTPHGFFSASGVNIRSGPGTNYGILGQGQSGQAVWVYCEVTGTDWYHLLDRVTGVNGYSFWPNNVLLDYDSPNPPAC
jgi:uncharacterized protein YgiM (DUF1202 family)